jgi:hypothetical protein
VYPEVSGLSHNEINNKNSRHSLRNNTKGYGGKTHWTDSQDSDTTALSGRELYNLQFSLQAASPETFGYTLVYRSHIRIMKCVRLRWAGHVAKVERDGIVQNVDWNTSRKAVIWKT